MFAALIRLSAAGALAFVLGGCGGGTLHPREVKIRQEWTANANFAGAQMAKDQFATDHHLIIKIEEGSESVDPIKLVAAGDSDFGDAGADSVLIAIAKGAPLVIVGVVSPSSPTVFLAKRESNIRTPKDFEGHRVGILTGTATEYVYHSLVEAAGVNAARIKEIPAGFDLQGFLAGNYDVRPAFDYDEPVSLESKGIAYTKIDPREYGVHFVGTVYFTRRELVEKQRLLVQDVVSSLADGWRLAVRDPERAIKALVREYKNLDEARELASLRRAIPYVNPPSGRILLANADDWSGTVRALQKLHLINDISLAQAVDDSFVQAYYAKEAGQ